jgi:hypothetical protein
MAVNFTPEQVKALTSPERLHAACLRLIGKHDGVFIVHRSNERAWVPSRILPNGCRACSAEVMVSATTEAAMGDCPAWPLLCVPCLLGAMDAA